MGVLEDKKGEDILLLDIREVALFADYFVICTGTSDRMLHALAGSVREQIKAETGLNSVMEGQPSGGWVVVDYGDVVVHLFSPDQREYYQLEELWEEGKIVVRLQ